MSGFAKVVLSFFNFIILIFGLSHIIMAQFMNDMPTLNPCLRENASSLLWTGVFSLVLAVIGIMGTCFRQKALQSIYLWVILITTIATIIFCIFISAMMPRRTSNDTYYITAQRGVWLREYRPTLQKVVVNEKDWFAVKTCFRQIKTCTTMRNQTETQKVVFIDLGCCSPPNRCGLVPDINGRWVVPETGLTSDDDECKMWVRVGQECFECDSCKAGYIANYQDQWDKNFGSMIWRIVVLVSASAVAYYTFFDDHGGGDIGPKHGKLVNHI